MSNHTPITFNFFTLRFEPYKNVATSHNTRSILNAVIQYIRDQREIGKAHLVDRYQNREGNEARELFMSNSRFLPKENRIICSLALLRKGRVPKLKPKDKIQLMPIKDMGDIAEETHFFIDFSTNQCIVCAEYNYYGPRWSDLDYYLRSIANNNVLGLAKQTSIEVMFDSTLDYTLANLSNVLHFDVKAKPSSIKYLDSDVRQSFFSGMSNIGDQLKPKFVRVEAYFQTPGKTSKTSPPNTKATLVLRDLLNVLKKRTRNIEHFEDFVIKYQNKQGEEEIFDLLKGKKEFVKEIDMQSHPTTMQIYDIVKPDINDFIATL